MSKLFTILFTLSCVTSFGQRAYYVSASGSNSNTGTLASPWQTIAKVNSSAFVAGDSILFKKGDTFTGSIITKSSNLFYGAYGTGAKPTISGLTTLTSWTNVGTNLWESTPAVTLKANCNVFTIDGSPFAVGRTPNTGFYTYQSATKTSLTSSSITATRPIGSEIVMKKKAYTAEKARIISQAGTTVNYSTIIAIDNSNILAPVDGDPGNGFFFQRFDSSLDQQGEWYFNAGTNKMKLYSTTNPSGFTIKASYIDTLFLLSNKSNITINGLAIEGAGMYGVEAFGSSNVTISNCSFNNNTRATYTWGVLNTIIDNNTVDNSFCNGIFCVNRQTKDITITNNLVNHTGQLMGMGLYGSEFNLKGIVAQVTEATAGNYLTITGNTVKNSGHAGIHWQGSNVVIAKNVIDSFCNILDDNGGIYTFVNNQSVNSVNYVNRRIDSNFIYHSTGSPAGVHTGEADVAGLYFDDQTLNVTATGNTIAYVRGPGIQMNNPKNMSLLQNIVYDCDYTINVNKKGFSEISGVLIHRNTLYQRVSTQYGFWHINDALNSPTQTTTAQSLTNLWDMDSNWISNSKTNSYYYYYRDSVQASSYKFPFPTGFPLTTWRATYGHDLNSILPPVTLTNSNTRLLNNATDTVLPYPFAGLNKIEPNGTGHDNSVNVPRWSSVILIDNGTVANQAPTANGGGDQTTSATSIVLNGSASFDNDGTISSYAWARVSGPPGGIISNATSVTPTVSLLQVGVYTIQLTVTDNQGATGVSTIKITVTASNLAPSANAGNDTTIVLPTSSTVLHGSGVDLDGNIATYAWSLVSGPGGNTINNSALAAPTISGLQQGVYQYQLIVTDNSGATGKDFVQITVDPAIPPANQKPTVSAGPSRTITSPASTTTLNGSASDADGSISIYSWVKLSGTGGSIAGASTATANLSGLTVGEYLYQLTVTDNSGDTASASVRVTVNAANQKPVVSAGPDLGVYLPVSTATINGSASDADGSVSSVAWSLVSGPTGSVLGSPSSAVTGVTALTEGVYIFQILATDNVGDTSKDVMQITVNADTTNVNPVAHATGNRIITLPTDTLTIFGSGTDADGTISTYQWKEGATVLSNTATLSLTGLTQGLHRYTLTVTDNRGGVGTDAIDVLVNAAVAQRSGPYILYRIKVP